MKGILLNDKAASLSGDEDDYQLHETTGDQFFDEDQWEACRALGFDIVKGMLTPKHRLRPRPNETEHRARLRTVSADRALFLELLRNIEHDLEKAEAALSSERFTREHPASRYWGGADARRTRARQS
jgi:hypothetical protein